MYLDENANDLDFEESLEKNHATPTLPNESMKTSPSKLSLFLLFNKLIFIISRLGIDRLALGDHAAMSIDFKGEGLYIDNFFIF